MDDSPPSESFATVDLADRVVVSGSPMYTVDLDGAVPLTLNEQVQSYNYFAAVTSEIGVRRPTCLDRVSQHHRGRSLRVEGEGEDLRGLAATGAL